MPMGKKSKPEVSITESASRFQNLEQMSVKELITGINKEDAHVQKAVQEGVAPD